MRRLYFILILFFLATTAFAQVGPGFGTTTTSCIVEQRNLFSFQPIDNLTKLVKYKGFDDLIPYIVACNNGYEYIQHYTDRAYSLSIPKSVVGWSFGFGNENYYVRFDTKGDKSETSIVIYYDFADEMRNFFFAEIESGKAKKNVVRQNKLDIYKTTNWEGKYEGKVFLSNSIVVAYYTRDKNFERKLQQCITSFKYD